MENNEPGKPGQPQCLVVRKEAKSGLWVFDDDRTGLVAEPFVSSATAVLDQMTSHIPNAEVGFWLLFSDEELERSECLDKIDAQQAGGQEQLEMEVLWTEYRWRKTGMSAWLCPNLMKYFERPPEQLFVSCAVLKARLSAT